MKKIFEHHRKKETVQVSGYDYSAEIEGCTVIFSRWNDKTAEIKICPKLIEIPNRDNHFSSQKSKVGRGFREKRADAEALGWKLIDSAPKDGSLILVWRCDECQMVKWCDNGNNEWWSTPDGDHISRFDKYDSRTPDDWELPTHWMPLPYGPE